MTGTLVRRVASRLVKPAEPPLSDEGRAARDLGYAPGSARTIDVAIVGKPPLNDARPLGQQPVGERTEQPFEDVESTSS